MNTEALVERFHRVLVEELRGSRPSDLSSPFTVAEIYQHLVPYGTHRDRLGVEMNGDYEDVLMRLLAGVGDYIHLESEPARRRLRAELDRANPDTGLYREYAAADVRLNPERLPEDGEHEERAGEAPTASAEGGEGAETLDVEALAPAPADEREPVGIPDEPVTRTQPDFETNGARRGEAPDACRWCRAELPERENLNFCPFCGTDVMVVPCTSCGEALEPEWRFCIACGAQAVVE